MLKIKDMKSIKSKITDTKNEQKITIDTEERSWYILNLKSWL